MSADREISRVRVYLSLRPLGGLSERELTAAMGRAPRRVRVSRQHVCPPKSFSATWEYGVIEENTVVAEPLVYRVLEDLDACIPTIQRFVRDRVVDASFFIVIEAYDTCNIACSLSSLVLDRLASMKCTLVFDAYAWDSEVAT